MDLALNNLQRLICNTFQPINQPTNIRTNIVPIKVGVLGITKKRINEHIIKISDSPSYYEMQKQLPFAKLRIPSGVTNNATEKYRSKESVKVTIYWMHITTTFPFARSSEKIRWKIVRKQK